jgi:copper chaperone NosL
MLKLPRLLLALAAVLVLAALPLPLWRIRLIAPQYPEGLGMVITARTVRGATEHDLRSINALNHYIGMKAIDPDAIPELEVMPWCIAALAAFAALAALVGRRGVAIAWVVGFAAVGVAGLWDFWRWEYSYGHDLELEHAIIKIPGMSYQPPLVGSKQLLNFVATSMPGPGALLLGAAFVLGVAAIVLPWRARPGVEGRAHRVHTPAVA